MGRSFFFQLGLFQLLGLSLLLVTADARDRESAAIRRLNAREEIQATTHTGRLTCENSEANSGAACQLRLTVQDSGRILQISGNKNPAMRLFLDGKRDVVASGMVRGSFLILDKIQAL